MESLRAVKIALAILAIVTIGAFIYGFRNKIAEYLNIETFGNLFFFSLEDLGAGSSIQSNEEEIIISSSVQETEKNEVYTNLPEGFTSEDVSEYYGRVRIVSASAISDTTNPLKNPSTIRINVNPRDGEKINVTGWKIQGNKNAFFIPKGTDYFVPTYGGTESDIIISKSTNLSIYSSINPIKINFRTNKCIGYVNKMYSFNPSIGGSCYSIPSKDFNYLSGVCQDFINASNGRCESPYNDKPEANYLDDDCKAVLNRMNYTSCYNEHWKEDDFLLSEFKIWIGINILDSRHDKLLLFDKNDKLVDEYLY
ncbi:MAG: hypothetical protein PHZ25_03175 [Candidatus Pacebacteria bacterium]|nr:hypothetical protein [Candidatus Paceibacterota bacterium]